MSFESPFPDAPRQEFTPNPLTAVVCQVSFPSILRIQHEAPFALQEAIQKEYPIHQERIAPTVPAGAVQNVVMVKVHDFVSEDQSSVVSLTSEWVLLQTIKYERWEKFLPKFRTVYNEVLNVYPHKFRQRVGIRFQDSLLRSKWQIPLSTPWRDLLTERLAGELNDESVARNTTNRQSEVTIRLNDDDGLVTLRHGMAIQADEDTYYIDSDFYLDRLGPVDGIWDALARLKQHSNRCFHWCISPKMAGYMAAKPLPEYDTGS